MPRSVPSAPSASALAGIWFVFFRSGHQFALWVSGVSGKEELYVDGALTAERRKIALKSTHDIAVSGRQFRLELSTTKLSKGIFKCVLLEDGALVAGLATEYIAQRRWQQSAFTICATAAVVYATFKAQAPMLLAAVGVAAVALVSHVLLGRKSGYVIRPIEVAEQGIRSDAAQ
jgi:hypothetical protein